MERARMGATGRLSLAACLLSGAVFAEAALPAGKALPISVDTRTVTERRMLESDLIRYSPRYVTETNAPGSYVVLKKVVDAGTAQAVTSTVATCEADAEGGLALQLGTDDARLLRLIHEVRSSDGDLLGQMEEDVGYGVASVAGSAFFAGGTNALQQIASARGIAPLAYSSGWAEGVTSVRIDYAYEQWKRGKKYGEGAGTLFAADAPADGAYDYDTVGIPGGDYTLTYTMFGEGGAVVDTYTACFSLPFKLGLMLLVK